MPHRLDVVKIQDDARSVRTDLLDVFSAPKVLEDREVVSPAGHEPD